MAAFDLVAHHWTKVQTRCSRRSHHYLGGWAIPIQIGKVLGRQERCMGLRRLFAYFLADQKVRPAAGDLLLEGQYDLKFPENVQWSGKNACYFLPKAPGGKRVDRSKKIGMETHPD